MESIAEPPPPPCPHGESPNDVVVHDAKATGRRAPGRPPSSGRGSRGASRGGRRGGSTGGPTAHHSRGRGRRGSQVDAVPPLTKREMEAKRKRRLVEEIREWRPDGSHTGTTDTLNGDITQGTTHSHLQRGCSSLREGSSQGGPLLPANALYTYSPFAGTMTADLVALVAVASAYTAASPAQVSEVQ